MEKKFDDLTNYYSMDRKKFSMEEFFGDLTMFCKDFEVEERGGREGGRKGEGRGGGEGGRKGEGRGGREEGRGERREGGRERGEEGGRGEGGVKEAAKGGEIEGRKNLSVVGYFSQTACQKRECEDKGAAGETETAKGKRGNTASLLQI